MIDSFNIIDGQPELTLYCSDNLTQIKAGYVQLGLFAAPDAGFLLYKFGALPWADLHFSIHLMPEKWLAGRLILKVKIDSEICREITLYREFSEELLKILKSQLGRPFDKTNYYHQITQIYQTYETPEELLTACSILIAGEYGNKFKVVHSQLK